MTTTDEPQTCGKGLAQHAAVPAKIASLLEALAENLALHIPTLVGDDPATRGERDAYTSLSAAYRDISSRLAATAVKMAGYRDLPMAAHDPQKLEDPALQDAYARYGELGRELRGLLDRTGV
jgi:hypothetical protein